MALPSVAGSPACMKDETSELVARLRNGDLTARERLILGHTSIALGKVNDFVERHPQSRRYLETLEGAALLALVEAVDKLKSPPPPGRKDNPPVFIAGKVNAAIRDALSEDASLAVPARSYFRKLAAGDSMPDCCGGDAVLGVITSESSIDDMIEEVMACCESEAERSVMSLLIRGNESDQVAETLRVSERWVRQLRSQVADRFEERSGVKLPPAMRSDTGTQREFIGRAA